MPSRSGLTRPSGNPYHSSTIEARIGRTGLVFCAPSGPERGAAHFGRRRQDRLRVGIGYDVHVLEPGRRLVLGGVPVDCDVGLAGHSDADVVLHAVADAVLGACGAGDIGEYFPDDDPAWEGLDSGVILRRCLQIARERHLAVGNTDVIIFAQRPRLTPWKPRIRASLAHHLGVGEDVVNVKAKTTEGLGVVGAGQAMACQAVVVMTPVGCSCGGSAT